VSSPTGRSSVDDHSGLVMKAADDDDRAAAYALAKQIQLTPLDSQL
jgi:hypothetical protein